MDSVRATLAPRPFAIMDTTTITHTRARPTAITDLIGSQVESSSVPVRGITGTGAVAGVTDAATTDAEDGAVMDAAAIMVGAAMPDADMLATVMLDKATHVVARAASGAVRLAADSTAAVVDSTVAEAADSTEVAVVVSTAAEADTGNL